MTGYLLPLLFTAAAGALTYAFCIRPMLPHCLKGVGGTPSGGSCHASAPPSSGTSADSDAEIRRLQAEVQLLRRELGLAPQATVPLDKEAPR